MRKSEPDSKYFVKSLENEILPVKINENRRKLCKLFTVWFPKGIDDVQILQNFDRARAPTSKWRISTSRNTFSKIFHVSDHQVIYLKLCKAHFRHLHSAEWRSSRRHPVKITWFLSLFDIRLREASFVLTAGAQSSPCMQNARNMAKSWLQIAVNPFLENHFRRFFLWVTLNMSRLSCVNVISGIYFVQELTRRHCGFEVLGWVRWVLSRASSHTLISRICRELSHSCYLIDQSKNPTSKNGKKMFSKNIIKFQENLNFDA